MTLSPLYEWRTASVPDTPVAGPHALPRAAAHLLAGRGITSPEELDDFLSPTLANLSDPFDFPGMKSAAERIWRAIDDHEEITIFGDFDADGISATAILTEALAELGATAHGFLPQRVAEGYGVTRPALTRCLQTFPATRLLITVDCGVTARNVLAELLPDADVIITDHHHLPGPDEIPDAHALVHPLLPGTPPGSQFLCGAGVAFKLVHALVKLGRQTNRPAAARTDPRRWLDAAAVATVADVVPLTGENRILVHAGLQRLARAPSTGLAALVKCCQLKRPPTSHDLAFRLGPRINASGRLDDAAHALALLRATDPQTAAELATLLDELNTERRTLEQKLLAEILDELTARPPAAGAVVIARSDWHPGLLGILAARLSERFQRPAAVLTIVSPGLARGSLRADARFDLMRALKAASPALLNYGGHARAAGLALHPDDLPEFEKRFADACCEQQGCAPEKPLLQIDAWLDPDEINADLYAALQRFEPYGEGHAKPCWAASLELTEPPRVMGSDGTHLSFAFKCGRRTLRGVWFNAGHDADAIHAAGNRFDVAFELAQNTYFADPELELRVADLRSAQTRQPEPTT